MQWCLAVDVGTVDVDFVVVDEGYYVMDVAMLDGCEQNIAAHFLHVPYHFLLQK